MKSLRYGLALAVLAVVGAACRPGAVPPGTSGQAKNYPHKTVTLICPWSAGGGTDRVSRFWADALQREFGQPFVVANRTGGSGAKGHSDGALARPDGYTLTTITFELSTMHHMGISPLTHEDFECLLQMNADPAAILVRADAPWQTLPEFLERVRDHGEGKLKMSGTAQGGAWDLARAGLMQAADIPLDALIWVPNDGAAPSLVALLGGHIDAVCCSVPEAAAQLESGQLRVLAVLAEERLPDYPDLPTATESGIEWAAVGWRGLAVPKGTPQPIVESLQEKCRAIAQSEAFRHFMQQNRFGIEVKEGAEFREFLARQDQQWQSVIRAAGYAR